MDPELLLRSGTSCGFSARPNETGIVRAKSGFNLVQSIAEVVVNGGDAGEVELRGRDRAGQHLQPHSEKAPWVRRRRWWSGGGQFGGIAVDGYAGCVDARCGWHDDEALGKKGYAGWVLAAHGELDRLHVDGGVHH